MPLTNQPYGLQTRGTDLLLNGQRIRHIGMCYFQAFMQEIGVSLGVKAINLDDTLRDLKNQGFKFVRIAFGFYAYADWRDRYYEQKPVYWATVQRVLDACHAAGLGVGVCMAWLPREFAKLTYHVHGASESMGNYGEPSSNLWALWSDYVTNFVQRFANHPAVWYWQPHNESSTALGYEWHPSWKLDGTGTDQGGTSVNNVVGAWWAKPEGGSWQASDKMMRHQWQRHAQMVVDLIRRNDPHGRMICSGNGLGGSLPVRTAVINSLGSDTYAQWAGQDALTEYLPWPVYRDRAFDCIVSHIYPVSGKPGDGQYWSDVDCPSFARMIQYHKEWSDAARKPFFLEEFNAGYWSAGDFVNTNAAEANASFASAVQAVVDNDIQLSAVWNWGGQLPSGELPLGPGHGNTGPEWGVWDMSHSHHAAKLELVRATNAARS